MSLSKMTQSQDIRKLWTTDTMSLSNIPVSLMEVCKVSNPEGSSSGTNIAKWYLQDSNIDLEGQDSREERIALQRFGTTDMNRSSPRRLSEPSLSLDRTPSSIISVLGKYAPHQPYWLEQHTRLPLPLVEFMENEALEILTKALKSYRWEIGKDHGQTLKLQNYIERLRKNRAERANVLAQRNQQSEEKL